MTRASTFCPRGLRHALSRQAYAAGVVRIADRNLDGCDCLVATRDGLYGGSKNGVRRLLWGSFFGICRQDDALFLFETCDEPSRLGETGRLLRFNLLEGWLGGGAVLTTGLDNGCHQIALVDDMLCVVDTRQQAIRRFRLDGVAIDVLRPVPDIGSGEYRHVNSIAVIGGRVGILLHNGPVAPPIRSELAWLNRDWQIAERRELPGRGCHDIAQAPDGTIWHCGSQDGAIVTAEGLRIVLTPRMTRGLIAHPDGFVVGTSLLGDRRVRAALPGSLLYVDRSGRRLVEVDCPGAPTQLLALTERYWS